VDTNGSFIAVFSDIEPNDDVHGECMPLPNPAIVWPFSVVLFELQRRGHTRPQR